MRTDRHRARDQSRGTRAGPHLPDPEHAFPTHALAGESPRPHALSVFAGGLSLARTVCVHAGCARRKLARGHSHQSTPDLAHSIAHLARPLSRPDRRRAYSAFPSSASTFFLLSPVCASVFIVREAAAARDVRPPSVARLSAGVGCNTPCEKKMGQGGCNPVRVGGPASRTLVRIKHWDDTPPNASTSSGQGKTKNERYGGRRMSVFEVRSHRSDVLPGPADEELPRGVATRPRRKEDSPSRQDARYKHRQRPGVLT